MLDDVLVNFDAQRAKAAAAVLRDFAAAGHQLLVFTCHEHIAKLFKSLRVPVSQLPEIGAEAHPAVVVFEEPAKESHRRSRAATLPPKTAAKEQRAKAEESEEALPPDDAPWTTTAPPMRRPWTLRRTSVRVVTGRV